MGLAGTLDLSYGLMPTAARKAWLGQNASGEPEAEASWWRILTSKRPDQFCSVDQAIHGQLTHASN